MHKGVRAMFKIFLLSILCANSFAQNFFERVAKRVDGTEINYYFQPPSDLKKFPILLVIQGSDCKSVFRSAQSTEKELAISGFARLDVEKYGLDKNQVACPSSYLQHNRINQRVEDYLRVIQTLRKTEANWNQELYIVGGSEGAMIAPIVASYVPETTKLVLIASGGGTTMRSNMLILQKREMEEEGKSAAEIESALKETEMIMDEMILNPVPGKSWAGATNTYYWWSSILDILPMNFTIDLNFPILALHGSADRAVDVSDSRILANEFKKLGKNNLEYKEYAGLDHHWNDENGRSHVKEVIDNVFEWLMKK